MGLEKSAEAIVAGAALWFRAKGRIFRCREQSGEIRWVDRPAIALPRTGRRFHGAAARRNQPAAFEEAMATHGIPSATGLGAGVVRFHHSEETAVYGKYVRWCGRTGPRGPSYPIRAIISHLLTLGAIRAMKTMDSSMA